MDTAQRGMGLPSLQARELIERPAKVGSPGRPERGAIGHRLRGLDHQLGRLFAPHPLDTIIAAYSEQPSRPVRSAGAQAILMASRALAEGATEKVTDRPP